MERGEFNDLMKDAFKDAEVTPSGNVWTNIELDLEKAAGDDIRRRLFYYKMVAAASVVFALSVGATTLYYLSSSPRFGNQQALLEGLQSKVPTESIQATSEVAVVEEEGMNANQTLDSKLTPQGTNTSQSADANLNLEKSSEVNTRAKNSTSGKIKEETTQNQNSEVNGNVSVHSTLSSESGLAKTNAAKGNKMNSLTANSNASTSQNAGELNQPAKRVADGNQFIPQSNAIQTSSVYALQKNLKPTIFKVEEVEVQPDPGALLLARLEEQEKAIQAEENKKDTRSDRLWTSVGVAAGSFNAVNSNVSPGTMSTTASPIAFTQNVSVANQQAKASGSTYSVGINVGAKIAKRWVVQGGFNYMTQSSDYTANTVMPAPDYQSFKVASYAMADEIARQNVVPTAAYEVTNSLQYVSMPIQAGYVLINRTIGVQLNSGISTDLFLQNTLTAQDGGLDKTTQQSGSESPYRTINFSGLIGTEISYKLGQHYRLALNPGLRYPFNSIYKSDVGVSASPLTFDIGLRCRYIFQ
jgi:hypothetical protein